MTRQKVCGAPASVCFKFVPVSEDALVAYNEAVCGLRPGHADGPGGTRHEYIAKAARFYKLVWPEESVLSPPAIESAPPDRSVCTCARSEIGEVTVWCMKCLTDKVRKVRAAS